MNKTESRLPLLDNDYLENESAGESSSGYESNDSFGSSVDLRPREGRHDTTQGQVMIFKSTSELQDSLAFIFNMPDLCDVTFLVGREQVPVHGLKAVLATRSRCLYQLILHTQRQMEAEQSSKKKKFKKQKPCLAQKLVITVMDYAVDDFRKMINYLHTGKVKVDTSSVVGLLCAAYEFGQESLHSACKEFIRRCLGGAHTNSIIASARQYMHKKPARRLLMELS